MQKLNHPEQTLAKCIVYQAREVVATHRRLFAVVDDLRFEFEHGLLTVHGELPTFYLKQLLQAALQSLDQVERLNNKVQVTRQSDR